MLNRRSFLQSSSLVTAGLLAGCQSAPKRRPISPNEKLNVGVIGVSGRGAAKFILRSFPVPRTFVGAAVNDALIDPQRNTVGLANRLKAVGASVQMKLYERVNHVTLVASVAWPLRWLAPTLDDVVAFIHETPRRP